MAPFKKKLSGGGMPPNPPSKAKFPNLKKKFLPLPLPNPGDAPENIGCLSLFVSLILIAVCRLQINSLSSKF